MPAKNVPLNQQNKYRALWEYARGSAQVETTPPNLQIAKNNHCNFKCVYCSDHRVGNSIPRTKFDEITWKKLMKLIPVSERLRFHGISEFMIDPDFFEVAGHCADHGTILDINTKRSVFKEKHLNFLAKYPNYLSMNFSLDAASPQTFLRIRGKDFWRILKNVRAYVERFENRRESTWLTISFVIMKSNVQDMLPFIFLAKSLRVDSVIYYRLHEYEGLNWKVPTEDGGNFNYREECTTEFADVYNRELAFTREAARILDVHVELPAPF
jgi:MoaA/NifB/PqqE/SkfB family radical SAM enzyme